MISLSELAAPSLSTSKVYLDIEGIEEKFKKIPILDISYSKEVSEPKGEGNITLMYSKDLYLAIKNYSAFTLKVGWVYFDGTEVIKEIATGLFNDVKHSNREINLPFVDYGVLLEQNAVMSFTQKKRSEIMREIVKAAGLIPIIDFTGVKDDVMDYSTESSSADSSGGDTVTGAGLKSCGYCDLKPGKPNYYKSTVKNYCNSCKKSGTIIWIQGSGYDTAGEGEGGRAEGHYFCSQKLGGCDADYCICGHGHPGPVSLTVVSGPEPTDAPITKAGGTGKASGSIETGDTSDATATTTDAASSESDGKSYWDMLMELIDPVGHDLQVIHWLNKVYINKVPDVSTCQLQIDSRYNLIKDSIDVSEGKPYVVNTVVVNYGNSKIPSQITVYDKRLKDKFEKNIKRFDKFGLNAEEAKNFAYAELGRQQRDNEFEISCSVIGHPEWYIGRWTYFNIEKFGYIDYYYITSIDLTKSPDSNLKYDLILNEYYPNLEQKDTTDGGNYNQGTVDGIMKAAAKFSYGPACQTAECMEKTKVGDCWAMSDWIYKKMTMAGIKARIVQYATAYSGRHRSVQVLKDGSWVDAPYSANGVSMMFRATASKPGMFVYQG